MAAVLEILVGVVVWSLFLGVVGGCAHLYFKARQYAIPARGSKPVDHFQLVSFHSYKPPKGRIPKRGKLVAAAAVMFQGRTACPPCFF